MQMEAHTICNLHGIQFEYATALRVGRQRPNASSSPSTPQNPSPRHPEQHLLAQNPPSFVKINHARKTFNIFFVYLAEILFLCNDYRPCVAIWPNVTTADTETSPD